MVRLGSGGTRVVGRGIRFVWNRRVSDVMDGLLMMPCHIVWSGLVLSSQLRNASA